MVLKIFEMPSSYFESTLLEDLNKLLSLRAGLWLLARAYTLLYSYLNVVMIVN